MVASASRDRFDGTEPECSRNARRNGPGTLNSLPVLPKVSGPIELPHITASQAWDLLGCPWRVVLDYDSALKALRPLTAAAILGTAAHAAFAALERARASRGPSTSPMVTQDVARSTFEDALADACARRDHAIANRGSIPGEANEPPRALPFYGLTRARVGRLARQRFGEEWRWSIPRLRAAQSDIARDRRPAATGAMVGAEVPLFAADGFLRGIADQIRHTPDGDDIEELKSGELTAERLEGWQFQLQIYAHLFREMTGRSPKRLRVISLHGATHEFSVNQLEAEAAARSALDALARTNAEIRRGSGARELARPTSESCRYCHHRPWCDPYWDAPTKPPQDIEGSVTALDGWRATVRISATSLVEVDFKSLAVVPAVGDRVRICGARIGAADERILDRTTIAWRCAG